MNIFAFSTLSLIYLSSNCRTFIFILIHSRYVFELSFPMNRRVLLKWGIDNIGKLENTIYTDTLTH